MKSKTNQIGWTQIGLYQDTLKLTVKIQKQFKKLRTAREKWEVTYKETPIRVVENFSIWTFEAKRAWVTHSNIERKELPIKNYTWWRCPSEMKEG